MKLYYFPLLCLLACLAAACGPDVRESALPSLEPVAASFSMEPANPTKGDTVTFFVKVTQSGEAVNDASEVEFEWWREGQEPHVKIPATLQSDGLYTAQQTLDEPGAYFVYYHVTARDFHAMQKTPFTVSETKQTSEAAGHSAHAQPSETSATHAHGE